MCVSYTSFSTELQPAFSPCILSELLADHKETLGNLVGVDNSRVSILQMSK